MWNWTCGADELDFFSSEFGLVEHAFADPSLVGCPMASMCATTSSTTTFLHECSTRSLHATPGHERKEAALRPAARCKPIAAV